MFHKIFAMHLQIDWILNILMVQAKNDEERSAISVSYTHLDVYKRQVLIGAGAMEMNNLVTSVPAILCIIAGICGIIGIKKNK